MQFTKMHGLGNDYLYVYGEPEHPAEWSVKLSNRHFGAGSDGMIWICPSEIADFKMRIFNADGSEAKMCGNGIRCVGKYVYDKRCFLHYPKGRRSSIYPGGTGTDPCQYSDIQEQCEGSDGGAGRAGHLVLRGENAPYIWMQCPNGMGSWDFFDYLLSEIQVVGTPGQGFGSCGEGYIRFSTFGSPEDTAEAARRLKKLLKRK